ncbi:50S ribosomal protein L21 [Immundisolibacter sp.]|uniref:50S ribosomal protein L21 n=1 Tax=Immundisolibacter sp. TaxID=1934948 RepID=UPI0026159166|nr:50S ribosomal protein L21 [Immundisolibacter sp.]MDD3650685.1 50S ribosomal protein L21 [Immundisolibacter sp.]
MFAVIETGGKQYRVAQGQVLKVEKLDGAVGDTLTFDRVLMVGAGAEVKIGRPYVEGATVTAELRALGRHPKIRIVKFRRRKHHQKQMGHRQHYAEIAITGIGAP